MACADNRLGVAVPFFLLPALYAAWQTGLGPCDPWFDLVKDSRRGLRAAGVPESEDAFRERFEHVHRCIAVERPE